MTGPVSTDRLEPTDDPLPGAGLRVLVIDNYDSFVYNLVQYLGQLGAEPIVARNDVIDVDGAFALGPAGILISPGPGRPEAAGVSMELIGAAAGQVPVFGVCLGHQAIGAVYGASVVRAPVMHGKVSEVCHDGGGVFAGLPLPLTATRYHSLVVDPSTLPDELIATAWTADGTLMGLRHRDHDVEGVQFHPESILTEGGLRMVATWLDRCAGRGPR
jgi:para-aminobenzoate synthetase component 2